MGISTCMSVPLAPKPHEEVLMDPAIRTILMFHPQFGGLLIRIRKWTFQM